MNLIQYCRCLLRICALAALGAYAHPAVSSAETTIIFGGDTHFGENYHEGKRDNVLESKGYDYTIKKFSAHLTSADVVIVNLETPITDIKNSPIVGKSYLHWADPRKTPAHLLANNISVVSLANNHVFDYNQPGFHQTLDLLESNGFAWFGAGLNASEAAKPFVREFQIGHRTFALGVIGAFEYRRSYDLDYHFYANETAPGTYTLSPKDIAMQALALKDVHPDIFIVAFPHWGKNYRWKTAKQTEIGHELVDSGVDMVIGHGAHMIQELELYHDRWIVYSLGNLVFNSNGRYADYNAPPFGFNLEMAITNNGLALEGVFRLYPTFTNNLITGFQSRYVNQTEFKEVESLLLAHGGTNNSLGKLYKIGQNERGSHYFELPLLDGSVRTEFMYDNFDDGTTGSYTLGSSTDASLKVDGKYCPAGSCIRLEDDTGVKSSFYTSGTFNASGQDQLEIDYWMRHRWGEPGDGYFVKYWDGKAWHIVANYTYGEDFVHNSIQNRAVVIDGTDYVMSCRARIGFESAGSDDSDDFYFDQIRVSGLVSPNGARSVHYDCSDGTMHTVSDLVLLFLGFWWFVIA